MNNIEKQVNEDLDDLMGHNLLKKINNENFDEDGPKSNKRNVLVRIITVLVPVLILALYFGVGRDFSNNTYSTTEKQYAVYQLASNAGFDGTYEEWLDSIQSDSVVLRVVGNEVQWKNSKDPIEKWETLYILSDYSGSDGLSAFEIWKEIMGDENTTEKDFFESLSAYGIWLLQEGNEGKSEEEFLESLKGNNDDISRAVYELYKSLGYEGSFDEWEKTFIDNNGEFTFTFVKEKFNVTIGDYIYEVSDGELIDFSSVDNPTKEHYEFDGWYFEDLKWNSKVNVVKANIELTPVFVPIEYKMVYSSLSLVTHTNPNPETVNVEDGLTLQAPIVEGYTFNGWVISTNSGSIGISKINADNIDSYLKDGKITIMASITKNNYSINYSLNGGINHADNPTSFMYGSSVVQLNDPTKEGYEFAGWLNQDGEIVKSINGITSNVILTAMWTEKEFTITYELNGGVNNESNPTSIISGQLVYLYEPTKEGYEFTGWYTSSEEVLFDKVILLVNETDDIELTATWETIDYKITYNLDGGVNNDSNPTTITCEDEVTLAYPTKNGYEFVDWTINGPSVESLSNIKSDITLTAKWEVIQYTISYNTDGGSNHTSNKKTITVEEGFDLVDPTKAGYTFAGWYTDSNIKLTKVENVSSNITLTAKWEAIHYDITYELEGGFNYYYNPTKITIEEEVILNPAVREHYEFKGWYTTPNFSGGSITLLTTEYVENEQITLYAKWERNEYQVVYQLNSGINNVSNPTSITCEDNVTLSNPTKLGYQFGGWYTDANLSGTSVTLLTIDSMINEQIILYAKWSWTIFTENNIEYFYYGTYPQSEVDGITGGTYDGQIVYLDGLKYMYKKESNKYYKYEEIKWKIVTTGTTTTVVSDLILDGSKFSSISSDYLSSDLYNFITNQFSRSAFVGAGNEVSIDEVYILNAETNEFGKLYGGAKVSDYAASNGVARDDDGYGVWWTAVSFGANSAYCYETKDANSTSKHKNTTNGVRPSMTIVI
ncbi:MAG: InlB B-repeat-containing protein [bacterium]